MPDDGDRDTLRDVVGRDAYAYYERTLDGLGEVERKAVVARIERGEEWGDVGRALGGVSEDEARTTVCRAILELAGTTSADVAEGAALSALVRAVAERASVDWDGELRRAADEGEREVVRQIRVIDELARFRARSGEVAVPDSVRMDPARTLSHYRLIEKIGEGGMGVVWKAEDTILGRTVAVKVLPAALARDEQRRKMFLDEARLASSVSEAHIVQVFEFGREGDLDFIVMEYVEGQPLSQVLKGRSLTHDRIAEIGHQVARALARAHRKGLLHRDLKPSNILITPDGDAKVVDFGLAALFTRGESTFGGDSRALSEVETHTASEKPEERRIAGTLPYMSPEQVRGEDLDARSDVFSLGVVLYEMTTGQRPFTGATFPDVAQRIQEARPRPVHELVPGVPLDLDRSIHKALAPRRGERYQTMDDLAVDLKKLAKDLESGSSPSYASAVGGVRRRARHWWLAGGATLLLGAAIAGAVFFWPPGDRHSNASETPIGIGAVTQVTADDGLEMDAALSPDGKLLAYAAGPPTQIRIFIRPVAGGRILTLSEGGAAFEYQPRWSPDGSQILFLRPDGVFVASALGGTAHRVAGGEFTGVAWLPDGKRVLLVRYQTLSVTALAGGSEQPLATGTELHSCAWSPMDDWVACVSGNSEAVVGRGGFGNIAPSAIVMAPATGGSLTTIAERTTTNLSPVWSPDGRHLYFVSNRDGPRDVYVMDIVAGRGAKGAPRRVTTGLGAQSIAFAARGSRLAYVTYSARANIWSMPIPSGAAVDTVGAQALTSGSQVVESLRVSPDHRWLVFDSTLHLNAEIFRMPIGGGPVEQLTTDPADDFAPDLSPDGISLAYHSWRSGSRDIYVQRLDGGPVETVTVTPGQESYPRWSPDGNALAFVDQAGSEDRAWGGTLFIVRRGAGGTWSAPVLLRAGAGVRGTWLRWLGGDVLAYSFAGGIELISPESGSSRLVYAPAPGSSDPLVMSVEAGDDHRTLYFKSADADGRWSIWSVPAAGGRPRLLVQFADPARTSLRPDFAVGAGRVFFTLEDRQADIWVADVTMR